MEGWTTVLTAFQRRDFFPGRWSDRFSDMGIRPSVALAQTALPRELNPEWHKDPQMRKLVATLRRECEGDDILTRIAVDLLDEPKFTQPILYDQITPFNGQVLTPNSRVSAQRRVGKF